MKNKSIDCVRVYFQREWEEYQVILPTDSSEGSLTYHTDDKEDALNTCSNIARNNNFIADHTIRGY